ncbi:MAG: acyltransferase, partial [Rhizobiaceae bacterium]
MPYRPDIDGLRAVAVMPVLLFHFGWSGFSGGFVGVDIFFVISGFLITRLVAAEIAGSGGFRFRRFYLRRLRRLFPALAVVLAASAAASFLILSPEHFRLFGRELATAILSVSNIYYFTESGYFDVSKEFKVLLHTWSLGVEEQFYLVWPVLILACLRVGPRLLFPVLAALALVSLACAQLLPDRDLAFFLTPFRAFEFCVGAALVWLPPLRGSHRLADLAVVAGLGLIALSVHLFSAELHLPGLLSLVPVLGAALCIHAGAAAPVAGRLLRNRPVVWIGRISYSLYLVHWPLFVLYAYSVSSLTTADRVGLLAASFLLAALLHRWVEQPLRRPRPDTETRFVAGSAAAAAACLALAAAITLGKG